MGYLPVDALLYAPALKTERWGRSDTVCLLKHSTIPCGMETCTKYKSSGFAGRPVLLLSNQLL